ncbi:MAG: hypothetical protein K2H80_01550 [Ureaplasma sp.]|nr:hypothetical protein [Ureaplasma sp.]
MSKKVTLELSDEMYDKLFKFYTDSIKEVDGKRSITFEEFLVELYNTPSDMFKNGKIDSNGLFNSLKDAFKNIDMSQLDDLFSSFKGFSDMFDNGTKTTKTNEEDDKSKKEELESAMKKKS